MGVKKGPINTESLLGDLGGCGMFQIILYIIIDLSAIPAMLTFFIEGFGIYNPGWKCLDNSTSSAYPENTTIAATTAAISATTPYSNNYTGHPMANSTNHTHGSPAAADGKMFTEYGHYSCPAFESCKNIEFSPDASTIVTEWGLICSRGWILSTILAIRMAGNLCSTLIIGYVGDRFGRRVPYLITRLLIFGFNLMSMFSVNWQMYAAASFCMGLLAPGGMLSGLIMSEYVPPNWRIRIASLPTWAIISILLTVLAMLVPDWRTLRLIATVSGVVLYIPIIIWFPESLRWMSIKGKKEKVVSLITRIAKTNKKPMPSSDKIDALIEKNSMGQEKTKYTYLDLFKKGYRMPTIIIGAIGLSLELIFVAFQFGIAKLPGNYYTNSMIYSATTFPSHIIAFFVANKLPRKPTLIVNFGLASIGLFGIVAVNLLATGTVRTMATTALVMVTKTFLAIGWTVMSTSILEFYPTVIRSTIHGYAFFLGSVGGVISPYLVPNDPSTFYICYLAMAILTAVCSCLLMFFPETRGRPLKDTFKDDEIDGGGGGGDGANEKKLNVSVISKPEKQKEERVVV